MADSGVAAISERSKKAPARGQLRGIRSLPVLPVIILALLISAALFRERFALHDPLAISLPDRLKPPVLLGGTWDFPLGTDALGSDIWSRIVFGARISLAIAVAGMAIGVVVGSAVGLVAGYERGAIDAVLMRVADLTLSYPILLLALLLAAIFGPSLTNIVIAVSVIMWARFARVVRGEVLSLRERDFIALARVAGVSTPRVILWHLLPNVLHVIVVLASLQIGWVILVEASLSFLGAGVPAPQPAWGSMVADGREYITSAWWVPTMPGLAVMLAVLSLNMLGDWLRDRFDPKLQPL